MRAFEKTIEKLRHLRAYMMLADFPYRKQLTSYKPYFKKYKIKKSIWQGVSYNDIKKHDLDNLPWLDKSITTKDIKDNPEFETFSTTVQEQILQWREKGYMILPSFFSDQRINELCASIEGCLDETELEQYRKFRMQDLWSRNTSVDGFLRDEQLLKILSFILGRAVIPFQTINFYKGTQQPAHSDSIHFTTEPFGYMIAAWVALEDIQDGSGELMYFPGSHKFPFLTNKDYDHGNTKWRINIHHYKRYEEKIHEIVIQKKLAPQIFKAKKGDVLIWHANLLHGGSKITNQNATRQSLVMHYYGRDVLSYCERVEKLTILERLKKHFTC